MKKAYRELLTVALIAVAAGVIRLIGAAPGSGITGHVLITTVLYLVVIVLWADSVRRRFFHMELRRAVYTGAALMEFWIIIRYVKYVHVDYGFFSRIFWYMYYIPMILLPLILFFAVLYIGRLDRASLEKERVFLWIPGVAAAAGILTNDLHQTAFRFPEGFAKAEQVYEHGLVYYISMCILGIYLFLILIQVFTKYLRHKKRWIAVPVLILFIGVYYGMRYELQWADKSVLNKMYNLPEFICLYLICFWESAVASVYGIRRQLAVNLDPQLGRLEDILSGMTEEDTEFLAHMRLAAVLNVYIKRKSNLLLLAFGDREIRGEELELSIAESLEYLRLLGIAGHMEFDARIRLRAEVVVFLYTLYEDALEAAIAEEETNAVLVSVKNTENRLKFYMEIGLPAEILSSGYRRREIADMQGSLSVKKEEDCVFVRFWMPLERAIYSGTSKRKQLRKDRTVLSGVLVTRQEIHDDAGRALLALRTYLNDSVDKDKKIERTELLEIWKNEVALFRERTVRSSEDVMEAMAEAAKAVGIRLVIRGKLPKDEAFKQLTVQATRECITNTVRHAGGTTLTLTGRRTEKGYEVCFTNDGEKPESYIEETGGLRTLRESAKLLNVEMEVRWKPEFALTLRGN